jgi:hypothetical protein
MNYVMTSEINKNKSKCEFITQWLLFITWTDSSTLMQLLFTHSLNYNFNLQADAFMMKWYNSRRDLISKVLKKEKYLFLHWWSRFFIEKNFDHILVSCIEMTKLMNLSSACLSK